MPSQTDVYNRALRLIGAQRVESPTDGTKNANVLNDLYLDILKEALAEAKWRFAKTTKSLALSSDTPAAGFDYAWALPSDHVRTIGAWDNDNKAGHLVYDEEVVAGNKRLVCDISSEGAVYMEYIFLQQDPNQWTPGFLRAIVLTLAAEAAVPIAKSNTLREEYADKAEKKMAQARSTDSLGKFPARRPRGKWSINRRGRGYASRQGW